ncbi:MAG TPA: HlyD family secretion protein [Acidobacteriota bacterium]|nr:HlyD family secretion protein [Acidobacteriota bacterium]
MEQSTSVEKRNQNDTVEVMEGGKTSSPAPPAAEPRRQVRSHKKVRTMAFVVIAALALTATTAFVYHFYAGWESTDDAQIDGYINPVSSRVAGYITKVFVDDNQFVKAGTLLVQIDPKDYQIALDISKATLANEEATAAASRVNVPITSVNTSSQLASAQADVVNARAGVSASEKQLAAARASEQQAEANNAKAQDDVNRYKLLVEKEEISEQQYSQATATARAAAAAVDAARATVQAAEDQVTQARGRLDQALAELESARTGPEQIRIQKSRAMAAAATVEKSRTAVEQARLNLSYTRIVAPVDGIVAKRAAQAGQNVTPGQPLLSVVPLDNIWVTANFKETQLKDIRPGQPVVIFVDGYDRNYSGRVESIAGGTGSVFSLLPAENATGNYVKVVQRVPVRIRFEKSQDPQHQLRPGMSVEPKVKVD